MLNKDFWKNLENKAKKTSFQDTQETDRDISGLYGGGKQNIQRIQKRYEDIADKLGWSPYDTPQDMEREAYLNQGGGEVFGNMLGKLVGTTVSGFLDDYAADDPVSLYNTAYGNYEAEAGNWLHDLATKVRAYTEENTTIYKDGDSMLNGAYWADLIGNQGTSFGIMLGESSKLALATALAPETMGASLIPAASRLSKIGRLFTVGGALTGLQSGIVNAHMNSWDTGEQVKQKYLDLGYDEKEAKKKGAEAATLDFRQQVIPQMALNALSFGLLFGKGKPTISAFGESQGLKFGVGDTFVDIAEHILPNVKNKFVQKAVGYGLEAAGESLEEGLETTSSKLAQQRVTGEKQDFFDAEFRDSVLGGAVGSLLPTFLGRALSNYTQGTAAKQYSKAHDNFLADAVSRTSNTFENQQKVQQEYTEADKAYKENKSKSNLERLERASQMVKEAQYNSHLTNTVNALELDYINGKTTAFETHIEQMQTLLDAANSGDIETLKKYNIIGQDNKEKFEGAIDTIKNTFEQNIQDSHLIKEKLENNLLNVTSDFESAFDITKKEYLNTKNLDNVSEYATALNTMYSKDTQFKQLSSEGKRRFQLEAELESFNRLSKLSDLDLQRKQEIQTELEGLEDYKANDKRVVDSINKMPYVSAYVSIASTHQSIEDTNTELSKLRDTNNIREKVKERNKKKVEKAKSKEEVQEVVQQAQKKDTFTPELKTIAEKKKSELSAKETIKKVNPEFKPNPKEEIKENSVEVDSNDSEGMTTLGSMLSNGTLTSGDSGIQAFSPREFKANDITDEHKEKLKSIYNNTANRLDNKLGREANFGDFIKSQIEQFGYDKVDEMFEGLKYAWSNIGRDTSDAQQVYNTLYNSDELGMDILSGYATTEEVVEATNKIVKDAIVDNSKTSEFDKDNRPVDKDGNHTQDGRTSIPKTKAAFLGIQYVDVKNADGSITRMPVLPQLNQSEQITNHYVLDPDFIKTGTVLKVTIPENVNSVKVADWTFNDNTNRWEKSEISFGDWVKKHKVEPGTQKYNNKVPMVASVDGNNAFFLHDTDWYNTTNVTGVDPEAQRENIRNGRAEVQTARAAILSGKDSIKIDERRFGSLFRLNTLKENNQPITLSEATGDTRLTVATSYNELADSTSKTNGPVNSKIKLVNNLDKNRFEIGQIYEIRKVNTDEYIALPVLTNNVHENEEINDVAYNNIKFSLIASIAINAKGNQAILSHLEEKYGMTLSKAQDIQASIRQTTGIDIQFEIGDYMNMFVQVEQRASKMVAKLEDNSINEQTGKAKYPLNTNYISVDNNVVKIVLKDGSTISKNAKGFDNLPGINLNNITEKSLPYITNILDKNFGDSNGTFKKTHFDVSKTQLGKNKPFVKISSTGSVVSYNDNKHGENTYEGYIKDTVKTNVKSFAIKDAQGNTKWVTDVQPMVYYSVNTNEEIKPVQSVGNQSDIESKKADIEGQVGTSNYSVVNGLIFYNNPDGTMTPVANPEGKPVMDVIIADIERRRQEAKLPIEINGKNIGEDLSNYDDGEESIKGQGYKEIRDDIVKKQSKGIISNEDKNIIQQEAQDLLNSGKSLKETSEIIYHKYDIKVSAGKWQLAENRLFEINAEYDAELAVLENKQDNSIESKKADIERMRQEELNHLNNIAADQLLSTLVDFHSNTKGELTDGDFNGGERVYTPVKSLQGKKSDGTNGYWISFTSDVEDISKPAKKKDIDKLNAQLYSEYKRINAKYDRKLEVLEQQSKTTKEKAQQAAQEAIEEIDKVENESIQKAIEELPDELKAQMKNFRIEGFNDDIDFNFSRRELSQKQIEELEEIQSNLISSLTPLQQKKLIGSLFNLILADTNINNGTVSLFDIAKRIDTSVETYVQPELDKLIAMRDNIVGLNNPNMKPLIDNFNSQIERLEKVIEEKDKITSNGIPNTNPKGDLYKKFERFLAEELTGTEDMVENEDGEVEFSYNMSSLEKDVKITFSNNLKIFFANIKKQNPKNREDVKNFAYLNEFQDVDDVIQSLVEVMVGLPSSIDDLISVLETKKDNPTYAQILNKIKSASEDIQNEILYKMIQSKLDMHMVLYSYNRDAKTYSLKIINPNSSSSDVKLKQQWQSDFINSDAFRTVNEERVYNKSVVQSIINNIDEASKIGKISSANKGQIKPIFDSLGIRISDNTLEKFLDENGDNIFTSSGVLGVFKNNLETILSNNSNNEVVTLEDENNSPYKNAKGVTDELIDLEIELNGTRVSKSFRVGGKSIQGAIQKMMVYDIKEQLKDIDSPFFQALSEIPYSKANYILELLRTNDKFRDNFDVSFVSLESIKQNKQKVYDDRKINKLATTDNMLTQYAFFQNTLKELGEVLPNTNLEFRMGHMFNPSLSDKEQMILYSTALLNLTYKNFNISEEGKVSLSAEVIDFLTRQIFDAEFDRIVNTYQNPTNIKNYDGAAKRFLSIPELNNITSTEGANIHTVIAQAAHDRETVEALKEQFREKAMEVIEETMNFELLKKVDIEKGEGTWFEAGFIQDNSNGTYDVNFFDSKYLESKKGKNTNLTNAQLAQIAALDFIVNQYLNQNNTYQLIAGDMALYAPSIKKFTNKETKEIDNVGFSKAVGEAITKRMAMLIAPGNKLANSKDDKYLQIFVNDPVKMTSTAREFITQYYGSVSENNNTLLNKLNEVENSIRNLYNSRKTSEKFDERLEELEESKSKLLKTLGETNPEIAGYFDIEGTDAQEYTTWKEHMDILFRQGRLTSEEKVVLQSAYNKLEKGQELDPKELAVVMNPIKPVYAGSTIFRDKEGNPSVNRIVYIKSSSFPLLPQLTKDFKLDKIRQQMENLQSYSGKNVRLSYQTANKVGAIATKLTTDDLYNIPFEELYSEGKGKLGQSVLELDRNNFKIQQDTPYKTAKFLKKNQDDMTTMGSQMWKIILGNNINKINAKIFPNLFGQDLIDNINRKLQAEGQQILPENGMVSGRDLDKIKFHVEKMYFDIQKEMLYDELGLNSETRRPIDTNKTVELLHALLERETTTRQYPEGIIDNLELTYTKGELEFMLPIWLSNGSNKFESLLQAIITNRLIQINLPGNQHISASSEGFEKVTSLEEMDSTIKSQVVWVDPNHTGELKATVVDGKVKESEILVQSKFRKTYKDENGNLKTKLIDLTKEPYARMENGVLVLNPNMIDEELLTSFSFRIPTSSHQSGAILKVVGFLPEASGDMLVVPKEHTKQIGEDFDIDKRTLYKSNYEIQEDGRISKLNYTENNKSLENTMYAMSEDEYQPHLSTEEGKSKSASLKARIKMLENGMIDIYKSVYTSPDNNIQKKINKILSFDNATDTAKLINDRINSAEDNKYFSIYSDDYQRQQMKLGADGKTGIGGHSNAVTFQAQMERLENKIIVQYPVFAENGDLLGYRPKTVTIGEYTSKGVLGEIETLDGERSIGDVHTENQNSATDNIKAQIMGKRNENPYTMNVLIQLTFRGFDMVKFTPRNSSQPNSIQLSSLFISQPIIRRYVELKEQNKSITSEFDSNSEQTIIKKLISEFNVGRHQIYYSHIGESEETSTIDKTKFLDDEFFEKASLKMTGDRLYDNLLNEKDKKTWDSDVQLAVLQRFFQLSEEAKDLSEYQSLINLSTSGLGISYFNVLERIEVLNKLGQEDRFANIRDLVGDFINEWEFEYSPPSNRNEYTKIGNYYIRPTTTEGTVLVHSLSTAEDVMDTMFPYKQPYIKDTINAIVENKGKDLGKKQKMDLQYKVISAMRDYLYSVDILGFFSGDINAERFRLFFDKDGNKSLASYLKELKDSKRYPLLYSNELLKSLVFDGVQTNGSPSIIKHQADFNTNFDKTDKYNSFLELLQDDKTDMGVFNGEQMTPRKLAQDLATYAYLANNENGSIGFRDFINVKYLNLAGVSENIRNINKSRFYRDINSTMNNFIKQFYQHNPEEAKIFSDSNISIDKFVTVNAEANTERNKLIAKPNESKNRFFKNLTEFTLDGNDYQFIAIRDTSIKLSDNQYKLFQWDGSRYVQIPVLGTFGYNEYNPSNMNQKSLIYPEVGQDTSYRNNVKQPEKVNLEQVLDLSDGVKSLLEQIYKSDNPKYKEFAEQILPYVDPTTKVIIEAIEVGDGKILKTGVYRKSDNTIYISPNILENLNEPASNLFNALEEVVLEEIIHSITISQLDKFGKTDEQGNYTPNADVPVFITKLAKLHEIAKQKLPGEYYTKNIYEFVAGAFVSDEFKQKLDSTMVNGKSLFDIFKDAIAAMLRFLKGTSYSYETVKAVYDLIKYTNNNTMQNVTPKLKGKMTFAYGREKRDTIKATSTFEAIKNGERTATTRYESDGNIEYWKKANVGDIIEFENGKNEKVLVQVTKPLTKLPENTSAEEWSKKEGWSERYFNYKVKPKLNEAWQIEYKLYEPTQDINSVIEDMKKKDTSVEVEINNIVGNKRPNIVDRTSIKNMKDYSKEISNQIIKDFDADKEFIITPTKLRNKNSAEYKYMNDLIAHVNSTLPEGKTLTDMVVITNIDENTQSIKKVRSISSIRVKPFVTEQSLTEKGTFRGKKLVFTEIDSNGKTTPVGARNKGTHIELNIPLLKQKFEGKVWTKPAIQKDGTKTEVLPENMFKTFEEFLTFVLIHEIKHDSIKKAENESTGGYETRVNNAALEDLKNNYNFKVEEQKLFTVKINQFNYSYNPLTNEVIHNSKIGNRVETNETQIGKVLAEYAKANNLETKEFNKQLYSKVGDKIVNINTGSIVTQKQIQDLFKEEIVLQDKIDNKQPSTFTYKGKTIDTDFELTQEQTKALERLIDFAQSSQEEITLSGYAGTGKTSIIKYLERYLKGSNFIYAAPTHAATVYLGLNTGVLPYTVQSIYSARYDYETGHTEFKPTTKFERSLSIFKDNILVIDESSMVSNKDLENMKKALKGLVKIIYMGDKAQLPEVTNNNKKEVSKVFTNVENIQLTEVKRTNDNNILSVLTEIRQNPDGKLPIVSNTETLNYYDKSLEFKKAAFKDIKENPESTIYISYTNKDVQDFNNQVREGLGYVGDLEVGESIVGYAGYNSKSVLGRNLGNSIKYTVDKVTEENGEVEINFSSKILEKIPNLKETNSYKGSTKYLQLSKQDSLIFNNITEEQMNNNNNKIASLFEELYNAKNVALKNKSQWVNYYNTQTKVSKEMAKIDLGNKYIYNPKTNKMDLYVGSQEQLMLSKNFSELVVDKGIDFGYGITIHKSQGATFENVYFNAASVNSNAPIIENGVQIGTEGNSLMYVGMSRASKKLNVLKGSNNKELQDKPKSIGGLLSSGLSTSGVDSYSAREFRLPEIKNCK